MAIRNRLGAIVRANRSGRTERNEQPAALGLMLGSIDAASAEGREALALAVTQEKLMLAEMRSARDQAGTWGEKAVAAVSRGDDAGARDCLRRQRECEVSAESASNRAAAFSLMAERARAEIHALETKRNGIESTHNDLSARLRLAESQVERAQRLANDDSDAQARALKRTTREVEALAAAYAEIRGDSTEFDRQFLELSASSEGDGAAQPGLLASENPQPPPDSPPDSLPVRSDP